MMTVANLIAARGKGVVLSGRSGCVEGSQAVGFPSEVIYFQGKVTGDVTDGGLQITKSKTTGTQGLFVPFKQGKATLGVLSGPAGFFISDQFGGCDFTILKNPKGQWVGSHVYSNDTCRSAMTSTPTGWSNVYTWRSSPYAKKFGMTGSILCVCFVTGTSLKFVMLHLSGYPTVLISKAVMSANVKI